MYKIEHTIANMNGSLIRSITQQEKSSFYLILLHFFSFLHLYRLFLDLVAWFGGGCSFVAIFYYGGSVMVYLPKARIYQLKARVLL